MIEIKVKKTVKSGSTNKCCMKLLKMRVSFENDDFRSDFIVHFIKYWFFIYKMHAFMNK